MTRDHRSIYQVRAILNRVKHSGDDRICGELEMPMRRRGERVMYFVSGPSIDHPACYWEGLPLRPNQEGLPAAEWEILPAGQFLSIPPLQLLFSCIEIIAISASSAFPYTNENIFQNPS